MAPDTDRLLAITFLRHHPISSARTLEAFDPREAAAALEVVGPDDAADIIERLSPPHGAACLAALEHAGAVLARLEVDVAALLLRRLPEESRRTLLDAASSDLAAQLHRLLDYPEGTAGALADPTPLVLPFDITAGEALDRVRAAAATAMYYLYVLDRDRRLVGVLTLRELMLAAPGAGLEGLMQRRPERLRASMDRTAILAHPGWRVFHALPVTDEERRFVGALRYETLRAIDREGEVGMTEGLTTTAVALGELYWVGLTGVLEGLGHTATRGEP